LSAAVLPDPPKPRGGTVGVRIDGKRGPVHGEGKHARRRLRPPAGQRLDMGFRRRVAKIVQAAETGAALSFLNGRQDLLAAARFLVGDATAAHGAGEELRGRAPRPAPS
jgi:hypothetical protein